MVKKYPLLNSYYLRFKLRGKKLKRRQRDHKLYHRVSVLSFWAVWQVVLLVVLVVLVVVLQAVLVVLVVLSVVPLSARPHLVAYRQ